MLHLKHSVTVLFSHVHILKTLDSSMFEQDRRKFSFLMYTQEPSVLKSKLNKAGFL